MLPVEAVLPDLLAALARRTEAVLVAPPGAGKTTRVAPALLAAPWVRGGQIVLLSPRRIAARAAAARIAAEMGEPVGKTVGYRVRLDSKLSEKTRILVLTEGVFTRMIADDPSLPGVAAVLFDEFHERSLEGDLGLALARDAQQGLREDLRLVVMSATLDSARVAALLNDAPVIESQGRMFPVALQYRPRDPRAPLEREVSDAVRAALREESGSALVFLPGVREIERAVERLRAELRDPSIDVRPLYGALSPADQDAAITPPPPGRRKIVLATSIAETSLTIEGVRIVVDSGLTRRPKYEPALGLTRLETMRASQAAIEQRRGRAGRLEPGLCVRLWSEGETRALPAFDRPEILEADLAGLVLDLAAWGVAEPAALAWLDPPPKPAWREAIGLLTRLGALDQGRLTAHGRAIAKLPLPPRLAHMVVASQPSGEARLAARMAVLITEQGLAGRDIDLRARVHKLETERGPRAQAARALADRIARQAGAGVEDLFEDRAGAVLARGFPERVAKARGGESPSFLMANGRAAMLDAAENLARAPYLVIAEAQGAASSARVLLAAPITLVEIESQFAGEIETRATLTIDPVTGAARGRRSRKLGRIILSQGPLEKIEPAEMRAALLEAVREGGLGLLDWGDEVEQLRARVSLLRGLETDAWPDWSDTALLASLEDWLAPALEGVSRLQDIDVARRLADTLPYESRRRLDAEAPTHFDTPAGGRHPIDYAAEGGPALAVRLQELFGMGLHPTLANGRVRLLLRLLSPAHRPVQTTQDLPGFWKGSYAAVRADLRGRYPKHPWPEDPANAAPTRRAKPRGS